MATNFKVTRGESKKDNDSHYVVQKEWQKEREHVMKIEKELTAHEKTDMSHAHPRQQFRGSRRGAFAQDSFGQPDMLASTHVPLSRFCACDLLSRRQDSSFHS